MMGFPRKGLYEKLDIFFVFTKLFYNFAKNLIKMWSYNIDITNNIDFIDIIIKCQTPDNTYCNQKRISRVYIMKLKNEHIFNFVRYTFEDLYMAFYIKYLIKIDDEKAKEQFEFMFEKDLSEIVNKIRGKQSNKQLINNNN